MPGQKGLYGKTTKEAQRNLFEYGIRFSGRQHLTVVFVDLTPVEFDKSWRDSHQAT